MRNARHRVVFPELARPGMAKPETRIAVIAACGTQKHVRALTIRHRTIVRKGGPMDSVIYLVGLIVVVMLILSALGLR